MKNDRLSEAWALHALKEYHKEQAPCKDSGPKTLTPGKAAGKKAGQEGTIKCNFQHEAEQE